LREREPDGIVDPADFEKVSDQVMDALSSFVDPKTGHKPVKEICRRDEIFKGKHAETSRDILMEPAEGYSLTTVGPRTVAVSPGGDGDAVVTRRRAKIGYRRPTTAS
jgi:predicted AlkP superfamily phosphohydrolase/phosphomutase